MSLDESDVVTRLREVAEPRAGLDPVALRLRAESARARRRYLGVGAGLAALGLAAVAVVVPVTVSSDVTPDPAPPAATVPTNAEGIPLAVLDACLPKNAREWSWLDTLDPPGSSHLSVPPDEVERAFVCEVGSVDVGGQPAVPLVRLSEVTSGLGRLLTLYARPDAQSTGLAPCFDVYRPPLVVSVVTPDGVDVVRAPRDECGQPVSGAETLYKELSTKPVAQVFARRPAVVCDRVAAERAGGLDSRLAAVVDGSTFAGLLDSRGWAPTSREIIAAIGIGPDDDVALCVFTAKPGNAGPDVPTDAELVMVSTAGDGVGLADGTVAQMRAQLPD